MKSKTLVYHLQLAKNKVITGIASHMEILDVPEVLKKQVEIKLLNKKIFDFI